MMESIFNTKYLNKTSAPVEEKPLIMLVDDELENINALRNLLGSKYKIISGLNGEQALELIDNMVDPQQVQLIISDQRMPHVNGVEFFEKIVDRMPDTIRILLTGYSDVNTIIKSINNAQIYKFMTKPYDPQEVNLTVARGIEAFQMRREIREHTLRLEDMVEERTNELKEALAKLEKASFTDQLTGAHNRRFVDQFIDQELAQIRRAHFDPKKEADSKKEMAFILIDADHFKSVNDTYGHDAGDRVLIQITQVLMSTCRESDWVVRWGGEEFLIVCRNSSREDTQNLAERLRQSIEAHEFDIGNDQKIRKTCSMGVSVWPYNPENLDFLSWEQTLNLADVALYVAKDTGRNAWVSIFDVDGNTSAFFKETLMKDTHKLIQQGSVATKSSRKANQ